MGDMTTRLQQLQAFCGLYLMSLAAVALLTFAIRQILWLIA
jgi:hypothetical protein